MYALVKQRILCPIMATTFCWLVWMWDISARQSPESGYIKRDTAWFYNLMSSVGWWVYTGFTEPKCHWQTRHWYWAELAQIHHIPQQDTKRPGDILQIKGTVLPLWSTTELYFFCQEQKNTTMSLEFFIVLIAKFSTDKNQRPTLQCFLHLA